MCCHQQSVVLSAKGHFYTSNLHIIKYGTSLHIRRVLELENPNTMTVPITVIKKNVSYVSENILCF